MGYVVAVITNAIIVVAIVDSCGDDDGGVARASVVEAAGGSNDRLAHVVGRDGAVRCDARHCRWSNTDTCRVLGSGSPGDTCVDPGSASYPQMRCRTVDAWGSLVSSAPREQSMAPRTVISGFGN